jgi:aconitate hydratase
MIKAIDDKKLTVASVLSGNRNFEGRINPKVRASYSGFSSTSCCVRYLRNCFEKYSNRFAWVKIHLAKMYYLKDIWPTQLEIQNAVLEHVRTRICLKKAMAMYTMVVTHVEITSLPPEGTNYKWDHSIHLHSTSTLF